MLSRLFSSRVQTDHSAKHTTATAAIAATVLIAACLLLLFSIFHKCCPRKTSLCTNPSCVEFAKLISDTINLSANPCSNFDAYVCGGWRARQPHSVYKQLISNAVDKMTSVVSNDASFPTTGQSILQKASLFYRSCDMVWRGERDELPLIRECFRRAGIVWPRRSSTPNVLRTLFSLSIEFDWAVVIKVFPVRRSALILIPYSFVLAAKEQQRRQELESKRRTFESIRASFSEESVEGSITFEEANDLEEFFFVPLDNARINKEELPSTSVDLEEEKWLTLLRDFNLTAVSRLKTFDPQYLMTFVHLWKKHGEDKTHVFISWMAARYASLFANHKLVTNYYGTTNDDVLKYVHGHWCYELAYKFFGDILFAPYNAIAFQSDVRRDLERIALNIRCAFRDRLSTKLPYAVDVLPEVQWSSLEVVLSALSVTIPREENDTFAINSLLPDMNLSLTRNWEAAWKMSRLSNRVTLPMKFGWSAVHMFLPYVLTKGDYILAPYLILFPFYDLYVADAIKYGALGSHLAKASAYVSLNRFAHSNTTASALEAALDCARRPNTSLVMLDTLSDLASLTILPEVFDTHGSKLTLAGLKGLTATQLLFVAWCYIRCRGHSERLGDECSAAVQHVAAFSSAFACSIDAPLHPEQSCSIF